MVEDRPPTGASARQRIGAGPGAAGDHRPSGIEPHGRAARHRFHQERGRSQGDGAGFQPADFRPAFHLAARGSGRAGRSAAPCLHGGAAGQGCRGRGARHAARSRSAAWRGGAGRGRQGLGDAGADRGTRPAVADLSAAVAQHVVPAIFADISIAQLTLITGAALIASVIGGVSGYGTGALMPLVLVPILGPAPVVPIIALSSLFSNAGRTAAFRRLIDGRRVLIVLMGAIPTCMLGAWGYTLLSGRGAALVIGGMLAFGVPRRRRRRGFALSDRALAAASIGYGVVVGGTTGSGIILLSLLMAAGLQGANVIATDALISIIISFVKLLVFGLAGVMDAQAFAVALLIGAIALPGSFLAKLMVERMPVHVHSAILDAVVIAGGAVMAIAAIAR